MIGYDAETFLRNSRGYIPAERVLAGTKGRGTSIGKGVIAHPDNIMAEISSAAPFDAKNLMQRIKHDVNKLREHVAPVSVSIVPQITVSQEWLDSCENANEIGCDIDYQNGAPRNPIKSDTLGLARYAGGHIHFDVDDCIAPDYAASVCDVMLAVACIAAGEQQGGRRKVYGLPGIYRPKSYGVEYRTLSNFWLEWLHRDNTFGNLVRITSEAFENVIDEVLILPAKHGDYAREIIMNENQGEAANFMLMLNEIIGDL